MKVIIIEPVIAHYREDIFNKLIINQTFHFKIIAGSNYLGIKEASLGKNEIILKYFTIKLFGKRFYYLKGALNHINKENPDIIICSGIDFHHIHSLFVFILQRLIRRKRIIWWSHAGMGKQGYIGRKLRSMFYRNSDGIFVYGKQGSINLINMGVDEKKIQIVKNALNYKDYGFHNDQELNLKRDNKTIHLLFCGRINEDKKLNILLDAVKELKYNHKIQVICDIVGGGNIDLLLKLTNELNINDCVNFAGAKYDNELVEYFKKADIFVYPGGIGLSLVQAMSYGLPVITTNNMELHGPEIELLEPKRNGDLFVDGDSLDLANRIIDWVFMLKEDKKSITQLCINDVKSAGYLPEHVSDKIITFLEENFKTNN